MRVISEVRESTIRKTIAPKIVGIASINENLDASFKFKPIKRAAVIAVQELEAPGKRENTWKNPIKRAPKKGNCITFLLLKFNLNANNKSEAKIKALCEIDLSPDIFIEPFNLSTFYIVNLIS